MRMKIARITRREKVMNEISGEHVVTEDGVLPIIFCDNVTNLGMYFIEEEIKEQWDKDSKEMRLGGDVLIRDGQ